MNKIWINLIACSVFQEWSRWMCLLHNSCTFDEQIVRFFEAFPMGIFTVLLQQRVFITRLYSICFSHIITYEYDRFVCLLLMPRPQPKKRFFSKYVQFRFTHHTFSSVLQLEPIVKQSSSKIMKISINSLLLFHRSIVLIVSKHNPHTNTNKCKSTRFFSRFDLLIYLNFLSSTLNRNICVSLVK